MQSADWVAKHGCFIADPQDAKIKEEIDVLAARKIGDRLVLLVGEVKDFDLGLHRISAKRNFERKIADACEQIERKAALVERVWESVLRERFDLTIDEGAGAELVSILITTERLPLAFFEKCATLSENDLAEFADRIQDQPELTQQIMARGWKRLR